MRLASLAAAQALAQQLQELTLDAIQCTWQDTTQSAFVTDKAILLYMVFNTTHAFQAHCLNTRVPLGLTGRQEVPTP